MPPMQQESKQNRVRKSLSEPTPAMILAMYGFDELLKLAETKLSKVPENLVWIPAGTAFRVPVKKTGQRLLKKIKAAKRIIVLNF